MAWTGQQGGASPGPYPPPPHQPPSHQPPPQPQQAFGPPPPHLYALAPPPAQQQPYGPASFAGGPDFLATDRHNAVVVDSEGVSFERNGRTADFGWSHIRSVPYKGSYGGTTLMVAVVLGDGMFYECAVEARNSAKLQQWFAELAPVLGYYLGGRPQ
ncbi:hypothetical protein OG217_13400 [Streptomyces sp. NBC_01023]|uniref:hypothetical protein n=1 Tax=Streptomyces sp. NBC_01023 TaxID=2903724 RepID=UPI003865487D|nr:hypothetical protein OG217_13400 [Streptomyces sp. NBC_01023]